MPNRSMQAKFAKASAQRIEYAVQESFREASALTREYQMIKGKLVPKPAPATIESLLADHAAKRIAQRELARSTREALGKRTSFPWTR